MRAWVWTVGFLVASVIAALAGQAGWAFVLLAIFVVGVASNLMNGGRS